MSKTDRNLRFPKHFSAAIFDFDGTLADTTQLWQKIDREFFESRNIPYDTTLSEHISPLGFTDGARWVIETYHLHESVDHIIDEWTTKGRAAYQKYCNGTCNRKRCQCFSCNGSSYSLS